MCNTLDRILNRMSKIIHRIDAPLVTCVVMVHPCYSVNNRISHIDIRACHIYLGTEHLASIRELTILHSLEQIKILLYTSVSVWAVLARLGKCSSVLSDLICVEVTHISLALLDELYGCLIHLIKIVRCKEHSVAKVCSKPLYICKYGLNKLCLFLCRIRIVKSEIKLPAILLCQSVI